MTNYTLPEPAVMCDCGGNYFTASQLQAAYRAGREEAAEWQPIESAPKDGTTILVWTGVETAECRWYGRSGWGVATFNGQVWVGRSPTHWMPKPPPPAAIRSEAPREKGDDRG